jgi:hypothetical protein
MEKFKAKVNGYLRVEVNILEALKIINLMDTDNIITKMEEYILDIGKIIKKTDSGI